MITSIDSDTSYFNMNFNNLSIKTTGNLTLSTASNKKINLSTNTLNLSLTNITKDGYTYTLPNNSGIIAVTNNYETFGKAPSGHDNYYELCVLKSASDTENGGSLLLEATLGDYGREKQGYILCQISTRDGL